MLDLFLIILRKYFSIYAVLVYRDHDLIAIIDFGDPYEDSPVEILTDYSKIKSYVEDCLSCDLYEVDTSTQFDATIDDFQLKYLEI